MQTPKYNLHQTVYAFNLMAPLVVEFEIIGIVDKGEEGIYYSCNLNNWVREDYLYQTKYDAYQELLEQVSREFIEIFGLDRFKDMAISTEEFIHATAEIKNPNMELQDNNE